MKANDNFESIPSTLASASEPTLQKYAEALAGSVRALNRVLIDGSEEDRDELTGLAAAAGVLARAGQVRVHQPRV